MTETVRYDHNNLPEPPRIVSRDEGSPTHRVPEVEALLNQAIEMVEESPPLPLSHSLRVDGEPLLEVLQQAIASLPDELRKARWLLREREEYLAGVRREGDEIMMVARSQAERMVERTEVSKSAEARAKRIIADAEAEARRMKRETEDFCDARLASLEGILDRTRTVVATGRNRMQGTTTIDLREEPPPPALDPEPSGLFDQDVS